MNDDDLSQMKDIKATFQTIRDVIIADIGFHILTTISIILIVTSFFVPPLGIIDPSVFVAVGELFAFAALWELHVAVRKGLDAKISHHDTSISLRGNHDKDKENESEEDEHQM